MSLIICPECGGHVSDRAETCPHCGIRIASVLGTPVQPQPAGPIQPQPVQPAAPVTPVVPAGPAIPQQPPRSKKPLIISIVIAIVLVGIGFYYYNDMQQQREQTAYEEALQSNDSLVMSDYLNRYTDAPAEHRDSVQACLARMQQGDREWNDAVAAGTRGALEQYINQHPDTPHLSQARNLIDSIDYAYALAHNDIERYLSQHPDGRYASQAKDAVEQAAATVVSTEELAAAKQAAKRFFQAINSKNTDKLLSTVSDVLTSFLGRDQATASDVVTFMNKLYKADITNMNFSLDYDSFKADKTDDGNIAVQFNAKQQIERTNKDAEHEATYTVQAELTPEGKITRFAMKKAK